jgi:predicted O-methyltransferase YrrM
MTIPFQALPSSAVDLSLIASQYRTDKHQFSSELNQRISLLHPDVLALLFHLGAHTTGPILEIGPYIGGSTIALATGLSEAGRPDSVTSIELGASFRHETYVTEDIIASLQSNLAAYGVAARVNLIVGYSRDELVVAQVRKIAEDRPFHCMVIDADGNVAADLDLYKPFLAERAYLVVDDYYSPGAPEKEASTRLDIDSLVAAGTIESFGTHGWGTWFGRLR